MSKYKEAQGEDGGCVYTKVYGMQRRSNQINTTCESERRNIQVE